MRQLAATRWKRLRVDNGCARRASGMKRASAVALCLAVVGGAMPMTTPTAEAAAVGVRCKYVQAGGYRATHVFADFMPCYSVRDKLPRWLGRGRLPRNENGWYCSQVGGSVRACSYRGGRAAPRSFTFWL